MTKNSQNHQTSHECNAVPFIGLCVCASIRHNKNSYWWMLPVTSDILHPQCLPNAPVLGPHPNCQCYTTKSCTEFRNFAWNLVIQFSGKSLHLLPPNVRF